MIIFLESIQIHIEHKILRKFVYTIKNRIVTYYVIIDILDRLILYIIGNLAERLKYYHDLSNQN